jgi:hypothetical protein
MPLDIEPIEQGILEAKIIQHGVDHGVLVRIVQCVHPGQSALGVRFVWIG